MKKQKPHGAYISTRAAILEPISCLVANRKVVFLVSANALGDFCKVLSVCEDYRGVVGDVLAGVSHADLQGCHRYVSTTIRCVGAVRGTTLRLAKRP